MKFVITDPNTGLYVKMYKDGSFGSQESVRWVEDINEADAFQWLPRDIRAKLPESYKRIPVNVTRSVEPIEFSEVRLYLIGSLKLNNFEHRQVLEDEDIQELITGAINGEYLVTIAKRYVYVGNMPMELIK